MAEHVNRTAEPRIPDKESVIRVETYPLQIPREEPYLGRLETDTSANSRGTFVRPGNRTLYSIHDHSVLIKLTTRSGHVGWGECFGVVAPEIVSTIVEALCEPMVIGRSPHEVTAVFDDLYDSMRVRGYFGGFWLDAIAGIDMALWDLRGKLLNLPVSFLLGSQRTSKLPAYVSGLPKPSLKDRVSLAQVWMERGFSAVKFAAVAAQDGELAEIQALRDSLGPKPQILADLHWRYTSQEAVSIISAMEPFGLSVAEAPVLPEDIEGLAHVARSVKTPIAIGEELRTVHEYLPRFKAGCMSIIQPEMLHMGITSFYRVCLLADAFHCQVMPHATIGIGIGQAASLHVSAAIRNFAMHEYQHSVFDRNIGFVNTTMDCKQGFFSLPEGAGLGVEPRDEIFDFTMTSA